MNNIKTEPTQEELRNEVEELKALVKSLLENKPAEMPKQEEKIRAEDYVKVMSLLPYTLNLSTGKYGAGSVKKFNSFGEVKSISYRELVDIIESNPGFMESGYFYILDNRVIEQYGLKYTYDKILDKDKIEEILDTNRDTAVKLFKSANSKQQKIIVELLIDKLSDELKRSNSLGKDSNLNVIEQISKISGVNILEKAHDKNNMFEVLGEEKK